MMPFGMAHGSGGFQHHTAGGGGALQRSTSQQHSRHLRHLTTAAAAATAGLAGAHLHRTGRLAPLLPQAPQRSKPGQAPLLQIPRELAEVMCGAFGEIVQVAVLYPLDTIKVRCQAGGLPVAAVLQQLMGPGSSPPAVMRQLYAGVVSASLASVAVGSLYYFTFCAAKRAATKMVSKSEQHQAQAAAAAAGAGAVSAGAGAGAGLTISISSSKSANSNSGASSNAGTPRAYPHGSGLDCHGFDPVFAAICSDDKAAAAAAAAQLHSSQQPAAAAAASATASAGSASSSISQAAAELSSNGKLQANILAACAAAVVGAVLEAPVELFKHRAQAGQITGSMAAAVTSALKQHGPAALYGSFFIPFLFKSLPFDIGELMTYSSLNDWRAAEQKRAAAAAPPPPGASILPAGSVAAAPAVAAVSSSLGAVADPAVQQQQQVQGMPALASLTAASLNSSSSGSSGFPWPSSMLQDMPEHVWDMSVGAAAGAAAVLISMPPDCIKTLMETGGGVQAAANGGPLRSVSAFVGTGKQLVGKHGPRGLFMGLTPRLVESVPSTMLYWLAVEGCRRMLEPYVAPEAGAGSSSSSSSSS